MSEHPILFSGPMVRALLEGTKTQTRRAVKDCQPGDALGADHGEKRHLKHITHWWTNGKRHFACPYGQPGDRLWVRERHCFLDVTKSALSQFPLGPQNGNARGPDIWNLEIEYSDGTQHGKSVEGDKPKQTRARGEHGWRSSIHMPRWASRITLEITDVRAQRLQEISDARAEGAIFYDGHGVGHDGWCHERDGYVYDSARESFGALWDSINGKGVWAANPWVWALTFRRVP